MKRSLGPIAIALVVAVFFFVEWERARAASAIIDDWMTTNVAGTQFAPEQWRVALPRVVHALPLARPLSVALIETIALAGTLFLVHRPVDRYPHKLVAFFAAAALPCFWLFSYARPETLPTSLYVAVMMSLVPVRSAGTWVIALLATAAQSFVRADVPVVVGAAFALSRVAPALGVACAAEGLAVQLWLQLVAFPNARYPPNVPRVQLFANLERPTSLACLGLVAAPLVATALVQRRVRAPLDATDRLAVFAAALYAPLWLCLGSLREARIFVPFSFALVPLLTKVWSRLSSAWVGRRPC